MPPGAKCLTNAAAAASADYLSNSSSTSHVDSPLPVPNQITENSFQLRLKQQKQQQQQSNNNDTHNQQPFGSICDGWTNGHLHGGYTERPPAYWVLDRRRSALVAKFDYYNRNEFTEAWEHIARLTSPVFRFASQPGPCKISFRSYLTTKAHLDLNLHFKQVQRKHRIRQQQQQQQMIHNDNIQVPEPLHLFPVSDDAEPSRNRPLDLSTVQGEDEIWRDHVVDVPLARQKFSHFDYELEFTATPNIVKSDMIDHNNRRKDIIYALAIANFSLTPQCFELTGSGVDSRPGFDPFDQSAALSSSGLDGAGLLTDLTGSRTLISGFIDSHKLPVLLGAMLLVLVVIVASFTYVCQQARSKHLSQRYNQTTGRFKSPKSPLMAACFDWLPCCHLLFGGAAARDRRRIFYETEQSASMNEMRKKYPKNGNGCHHPHCLRPLSAVLDDVELNENPNYLASGGATATSGAAAYNQWMLANGGGSAVDGQLMRSASALGAGSLPASNTCQTPLDAYHIDRKRLTITTKIGKGAFGEVYQGLLVYHCSSDGSTTKLSRGPDELEYDENGYHLDSHSMKVAVKTLTVERMGDGRGDGRSDFLREAFNMSLVSHRNIVRLIGVCFDEKPLYIVMELLQGGNLKNFLLENRDKGYYQPMSATRLHHQIELNVNNEHQQQYVDTSNLVQASSSRLKLCMGDLLVFALDIARACDYLQKNRFIHRDLAARNCLLTTNVRSTTQISSNLSDNNNTSLPSSTNRNASHPAPAPPSALDVQANHRVDLEQVFLNGYMRSGIVAKLADFGMTRDVYSNDYYRMGHKELPVRWMPPECLDGVATSKSDVWSFGVFLWELFSMGQLPYQNLLDNHQVIDFIQSRRHARLRSPATGGLASSTTQAVGYLSAGGSSVGFGHLMSQRDSTEPLLANQSDQNAYNISVLSARQVKDANNNNNNLESPSSAYVMQPMLLETDENEAAEAPPLPPPHDNTPHPIYSIMCSCWSTNPEDRPQFEEIANRLYWCLQMSDVLNTSLPCFYEQHTPGAAQRRAAARAAAAAARTTSPNCDTLTPVSRNEPPSEQQSQVPVILGPPPLPARSVGAATGTTQPPDPSPDETGVYVNRM